AITAFLISGHESQAVIGFVEEPAFDIQIKFVGIIELCIRVPTFICPGSGVTGIHPVLIDHIATSAAESSPARSPNRYLGHQIPINCTFNNCSVIEFPVELTDFSASFFS